MAPGEGEWGESMKRRRFCEKDYVKWGQKGKREQHERRNEKNL